MNILDGLVESYGRILFITTNNPNVLDNHPALIRPGRIDKRVKVDFCDQKQVYKLSKNYYPDLVIKENEIKIHEKSVSPAQIVQILQKEHSQSEKVVQVLYTSKIPEEVEISTSDNLPQSTIKRQRLDKRRSNTLTAVKRSLNRVRVTIKNIEKRRSEKKI